MESRACSARSSSVTSTRAMIDVEMFSKHLYTRYYPDPDLLIRTSGEMRLSNFLLWQLSYTEMYVTPKLWPDFTKEGSVRRGRRIRPAPAALRRRPISFRRIKLHAHQLLPQKKMR